MAEGRPDVPEIPTLRLPSGGGFGDFPCPVCGVLTTAITVRGTVVSGSAINVEPCGHLVHIERY